MTTIGRTIAVKVSVDWDFDGDYTTESNRLISARGSHRLAPPGQSITGTSGQVAQMSVELDNSDNRYSPLIAASALYGQISGGQMYRMPVMLEVSVDGGSTWSGVFVGVLKIPRNRTLAPGQPKTIQLDARGNEERHLNTRVSTLQADFAAYHDNGTTEADHIYALLIAGAGLDPGEVSVGQGMFNIDYFWADEQSVIEACWRLAAAAGGRFYCTKGGIFTYEPPTQWLIAPRSLATQRTFSRADFENLSLFYDDTDLSSRVRATANLYEASAPGELWSADEPLTVPPGETRTITAELSSPAYTIDSVAYAARSAGGADLSAAVALTRTDYAQRVELAFENTHVTLPAVISQLKVIGVGIAVAERVTVEAVESGGFWDVGNPNRRPNSLATTISNPWIQSRAQAQSLCDFVRDRQQAPPLFCVIEGVQGDPTARLGDRITITDNELMDSSKDMYVIAIDWAYSIQSGFRQNLVGIACDNVFAYEGGGVDGGYFVLGTSKLGSGSNPHGVLFY